MLDSASRFNSRLVDAVVRVARPFRRDAVCMLHVGRVGSTVLADMLGQHDNIASCGEIWNTEHDRILHETGFVDFRVPADPFFPLKRRLAKTPHLTALFEIKFLPAHHMKMLGTTIDAFVDEVTGFGVDKFIVLERRNLLRRALSGKVLRNTGVTHVKPGEAVRPNRIRFDVENVPLGHLNLPLDEFIRHVRQGYAEARRATASYPTLNLCYEDDVMGDPRLAYRKCCDFLDVEPMEIAPRLGRTNPFGFADMLENPEQVAEKLRKTGDEWMLTSD
jgi:hypothetical protein